MPADDPRKHYVLKLASQYHGLALVEKKLTGEQQAAISRFLDTGAPLLLFARPSGKKAIVVENEVRTRIRNSFV